MTGEVAKEVKGVCLPNDNVSKLVNLLQLPLISAHVGVCCYKFPKMMVGEVGANNFSLVWWPSLEESVTHTADAMFRSTTQ